MSSTPAASSTARRRWLPWVLSAVLLGAAALGLRPPPAVVETGRASFGPLRATVSEEGKTRIRQRYVVAAPVPGQLRRIALKPGAAVAAGELVAVIEPLAAAPLDPRSRALAEARRAAAAAALANTRTAHELARSELARIQRMFAARTVSPQDLEAAQLRETAAALEVTRTEGSLRAAEAELAGPEATDGAAAPVAVAAPAGGRVLRVFQESAGPVAAGTPLLEVGDATDLEVVVELLSRDGAALAPGTPVEFTQWGGERPLQGRVRLVEPAAFTKVSALGVEEQRVNVVADLTTPLAERGALGDNFRVEARVIVWEEARVLQVPSSGLFRQGGAWAAFVVRGGRAVLVPVEAGRGSGPETQILGGLQEGDEVILYPGDRIQAGQRVRSRQVAR